MVNDEDILVVMLLSTMNPIRRFETPGVWKDPSAGSGVLSAELLGSPVSQSVRLHWRLVGLESQSDDQRGSKADIRC